jgi:hypothetical protein
MNKLYAAIAGAIILGLYTWAVFERGKESCEAKVEVATVKETSRQAEGAGELKTGDVKHGQQVEDTKRTVAATPAPQDCDRVDIGDLRVGTLGGVRD